VIAGTAPLASYVKLPRNWAAFRVCGIGAHSQIWGELDQRAGCTAMQHTPEISRSFDRYPDIGYHSLSASLGFLRWRRLISRTAALINWPVLSLAL
jgi:hypothetical protein